jgi:hypothetical protein
MSEDFDFGLLRTARFFLRGALPLPGAQKVYRRKRSPFDRCGRDYWSSDQVIGHHIGLVGLKEVVPVWTVVSQ